MSIYSKLNKSLCEIFDVEYNSNEYYGEPDIVPFDKSSGWTWKNLKFSEEHKTNISLALKGKSKPTRTEEHLHNLKKSRNNRVDLPRLGKSHSKESKDRISKSKTGISNKKLNKRIMTPNGIFESVTCAAEYYGHNIFYMSRKIKKNPTKFYFL